MKEWKIRQEIYHRLNKEYTDDLNKIKIEISDEVVKHAVDYFVTPNKGWIYPAKSYMVAICYSKWLSDFFGGDVYEYLNDFDILYNNDPYFVTYENDKETYDEIISNVGWNFDETKGLVPDVWKYFKEEFMI